jgi:hypothetical protein
MIPRAPLFALLLLFVDTCPPGTGPGRLVDGTWGGDNAGVIVADGMIHVHIGCTEGDAPVTGADVVNGRFEVDGRHNITAYPVNLGVYHPARLQGRIVGEVLTLTVRLTDQDVTLGPVRVTYGREPAMQQCPICRSPGERAGMAMAARLKLGAAAP